jgi:hypothetical protein
MDDETSIQPVIDSMRHLLNQLELSAEHEDAGQFVERLRQLRRLNRALSTAAPATALLLSEVIEASLSSGLALTPDLYQLVRELLSLQPITPATRERLSQLIRQSTHKVE